MSGAEATRFGKYRLLQRIAAGGMGEVHLAKLKGPSGFEKLVVIKRLLDHRQREQKYIDMFFSEARVAAQLNHSNIVQIYEVGEYEGIHYIAMEYVQGKSLRRLIDGTYERKGILPESFVVDIIIDLCDGLSFAHEARHLSGAPMGLIHRDINPHNVLISYLGEVKIIDFGIAKSELTLEQTQAGTIKGTVVYMSPEQASGYKLDKRSDLFSVGICLYEALTGHNPFYKDSLTAALEAIRAARFPPVVQFRRELAPFAGLVGKALARAPDDRYKNCAELADHLRQLQTRGAVQKPPMSLTDFMRQLFADDIAQEERLMSQTELAEIPSLGATDSIAAPPPDKPVLLNEEKTVMDANPNAALPMAPEATAYDAPQPQPSASGEAAVPKSLWLRQQLARTRVRAVLLSLLAAAAYVALWQAMRPSGADVAHTHLAPPTQIAHPVDTDTPAVPPPTPNELARPAALVDDTTRPSDPNEPSAPANRPAPPAAPPALSGDRANSDLRPPPSPGANLDPDSSRRTLARKMPPHRHSKTARSREEPSLTNAALGTLQIQSDPPVRMALNGAALSGPLRLRASAGTLKIGGGTDPLVDPFLVHLHYRIEQKTIIFGLEAEPWANIYGAGGISLGRTPLQGIQGGTTTVFEFRNPKAAIKNSRLTVRFNPNP